MGQEIRRVPPNWEHPEEEYYDYDGCLRTRYQPLYDKEVQPYFDEWLAGYQEWVQGGLQKAIEENPELGYDADQPYSSYCDWNGHPPNPRYYRPKWAEEPTWYQVYENVSEGTPITPPFATQDELIDYLCTHGNFWSRREWSREAAERFVKGTEFLFTTVVANSEFIDQTQDAGI